MTIGVPGERELPSVEHTHALGAELAGLLRAGDVVVLDGPLGAGKTALASGIAAGLGGRGRVSSPTFVIARRHAPGTADGPGLVHVDAYRLLGGEDPHGGRPGRADLADQLESLARRVADLGWHIQLYMKADDNHLEEITTHLDKPMRNASENEQAFAALLEEMRMLRNSRK